MTDSTIQTQKKTCQSKAFSLVVNPQYCLLLFVLFALSGEEASFP